MQKIPVSCSRDCSGGCPLLAHVEHGRLLRISDNPAGTAYMHGCINGFQMPRTLYHPERIRKPLIRSGPRGSGQYREAAWSEALDLVAGRLADLKNRYGAQSILNMEGSGSVSGSLHNTFLLPRRFFSLLGGYTRLTSSYSSAASSFVVPYLLGNAPPGIDPGTLQHSKLIILWGANLMDTRFGTEMPARLLEANRNGTPIFVVDPRRTRTVTQLGAQWIPCRPGTDAALMLAVLYVLLEENLVDTNFVNRTSHGFDDLAAYILGLQDGIRRDPTWAETICGTPSGAIRDFARRFGGIHPAALIPGLSIQRTHGGEETYRLSIALQVATGNLGRLGGSSGGPTQWLPAPRVGSLPIPPHPAQPSLPILHWPDAVLEGPAGGYPSEIKAIYNTGSNYLAQGSDVNKNIRAFQKVEYSVCHDYFLTPTARQCDVVLPAATYLERSDIVTPEAGSYLLFSSQAVAPIGESRSDYDIFCELADRLGFLDAFSESKTEEDWLRGFVATSDVPDFDEFRHTGIYLAADQNRVGLADFALDPLKHSLTTPSGKVEIRSDSYARQTGFPAIPTFHPPGHDGTHPLSLITPKSKYRIHSQGSNVDFLRSREPQDLWINPSDAIARGIASRDQVEIFNSHGRLRITVHITSDIMPGVVCLYEGVWPEFDASGVETAGSANVLSSTQGTSPSGGSTSHGIPVEVEKAAGIMDK